MVGSESWDQFCLLAWKHWLLQTRKVVVTILLIASPVALALILLAFRSGIQSKRIDRPTVFESFPVTGWNYSYMRAREGRLWRLAYTPKTALVERIMNRAAQHINVSTSPDIAYGTEDELVRSLESAPEVLGGVVFRLDSGVSTLPKTIIYKIRLKAEKYGSFANGSSFSTETEWSTNSMYPSRPASGPRGGNSTDGGSHPGYREEGFLSIQRGIDLSIIQELNGSFDVESVQVRLKRHPLPTYIDDRFVSGVYPQLPLYILFGFMFLAVIICQEIVLEKEKKLRESMKLMGLKSSVHWISWFFKHLTFALISVALMTILFHAKTNRGAVINYSNGLITFIFLLLYSIAIITFCFAVSTVFSKASKGAAASAILFVGTYVPNFFITDEKYQAMSTAAKTAASLDFNLAMAFGCVKIHQFEGIGTGLQWKSLARRYNADDGLTMLHIFVMLIVDIIVYSVLTYLLDMLLPGDFGTRQTLTCGSNEYGGKYSDSQEEADIPAERREYFEKQAADAKPGIKIRSLTKKFGKHSKPAVDNVSIDICEGNITALLGHNGAGKSTTMFILTGFLPPSDGTAFIGGLDIRRDMVKIRRNLGFCPQQDVLFDRLTVKEHLKFFAKLKGCPSSEVDERVEEMVKLLGLEPKADKESQTLSGGMKRKLCLGIAFIFGSKIIILDEPTSGLDPQARRQAWDIVKSQQKGRTIILSTHFMDEADILGDRIAIMAAGQIQCYGSPLFLKKKYGIGYHMTIVKTPRCNVDRLLKVIKSTVPDARLESNVGAEVSFVLPREQSGRFEKLFAQLEEDQEDLGIESFGASVTTMEEVFMKVGEAIDSTLEASLQRGHTDQPEEGAKRPTFDVEFQKMTGRPLHLLQFQALFVKRAICSWRNWAVSLFQILCPIVAAVLACLHVAAMSTTSDPPPLRLDLHHFQDPVTPYEISRNSTDLAASVKLINCYAQAVGKYGQRVYINKASGYSTIDDYLISVASAGRDQYNQKYIIGGTAEANSGPNASSSLTGWFNNAGFHSIAISLSYVTNAILDCSGNPEYQIETINHPLPISLHSKVGRDIFIAQIIGFSTAFIMMLGMAFLLSIFVMFLIKERHTRAKHLQYVSGIGAVNFWLATFAWDTVNYLIPSVGIIVVFECFQVEGYTHENNAGFVFLALIMYGWAALPCIYILSFIFQIPASGLSWILSMIVIIGMSTVTTLFVLSIPDLDLEHVADALNWVFYVVLPNFCLSRAFENIYANFKSQEACQSIDKVLSRTQFCQTLALFNVTNPCCPENCGLTCIEYSSNYLSWKGPGIGRSLVFMFLQGLVFFLILVVIERGLPGRVKQALEGRKVNRIEAAVKSTRRASDAAGGSVTEETSSDSDVLAERERVLHAQIGDLLATDSVVLRDFTKVYGDFIAVSHLSVGIPSGQCFGLLGVNGAGKTTTFKMLTGDVRPTFGDAYVAGDSVIDDIRKVHQNIGYCPQFDALIDEMTVRETVWMYACLRGIPKPERKRVQDMLIDLLMLNESAVKQCGTLSGGNKRRLSVAISLVGNPAIVFLDEPTTGMDPTARRLLWNTLTDVYTGGRTLVLTSHSMEECEALCTRLAIMVNGEFQCLGSIQHLKTKFNEGYSLIMKVKGSDVVDHEELTNRIDRVKEFVERSFPGSFLKDYHEGMLSYQVKTPGLSWSRIFGTIEGARDMLDIEDYSVSQTTLEQLFVSFARKQREEL